MSLPTIRIYVGLKADPLLSGPGVASLDLDSYDAARVVCTALGLTKSTATAADAEKENSGADLRLHIAAADTASKVPGLYDYQLQVQASGSWMDAGGVGILELASGG